MIKWVENTMTLDELAKELQRQEIEVEKVMKDNKFITSKTTIEDADTFLLLEEVVAKVKNQIVEVWKESKYGWTLRIMNSSVLDANATEYKINRRRERV